MAVQAKAPGNGPATGMQKTPAPTKPPAPDIVSQPRKGGDGFGQNSGMANPSRLNPGETLTSKLGANLRASVDDDGALQHIIEHGTARQDDEVTGQLRKIADGNVPTHPHMSGATAGPKIPQKLGDATAGPVRQPGK